MPSRFEHRTARIWIVAIVAMAVIVLGAQLVGLVVKVGAWAGWW